MPCPGKLGQIHLPGGFGVRVDTAIYGGCEISPYYDSMAAKVIVHDRTRQGAIQKMRSTLGELVLEGITTNLDFQFQILDDEDFINGNFDTSFYREKVSDGKNKEAKAWQFSNPCLKETGYIKIGSQPEEKGPSVPDGMWLKCSKCKNGLSGRCKRKSFTPVRNAVTIFESRQRPDFACCLIKEAFRNGERILKRKKSD